MSSENVDELTSALAASTVSSSGVSFSGRSLKLDTEDDAKEIVDAINNCAKLEYLDLEGNTLGVEAAKAIAKALEKHPELKRALWKDMFTGRMKSEIPLALEHLGKALVVAGARLTEIDLSDNAFGPIGVKGLAALLRSSSCYNLQELRLNNNGLGITGGKLLAGALMDCYNSSKTTGKPLALRVFIAGRNRLENDGAKALAEVFRTIGSLEEIAMPQNGIYHVGISALSDSFTHNKNLQTINLNDNTIGPKGSEAIAQALPNLDNLKQINFGDCLIKTKGALSLANALADKHKNLEELILDSNEIGAKGGLALAKAMKNKDKLTTLTLGGNTMGDEGRQNVEAYMKESGQFTKLTSLSDNESEMEESDDDEQVEEEEENDDDESASDEEEEESEYETLRQEVIDLTTFLESPSDENFETLGVNKKNAFITEIKKKMESSNLESLGQCLSILMKVCSLTVSKSNKISQEALDISKALYEELFTWPKSEEVSLFNNSLLIYLGLIKSEDKQFKLSWDLNGCILSLNFVLNEKFFLPSTKKMLNVFAEKYKDAKFESLNQSYIKKLETNLNYEP